MRRAIPVSSTILASFHPEMALFRNLGVNLRDRLCDVPTYVSAQSLDFLDLAKNCSFLNWKLTPVPSVVRFISGWALATFRRFSGLDLKQFKTARAELRNNAQQKICLICALFPFYAILDNAF